jgi:hypothetical protein
MTLDATPPEFVIRSFCRDRLGLSDAACDWLIMLWQAIQAIDDMADDGSVSRDDAVMLGWNVLVAMPGNPFFQRHSAVLLPAMALQFAKWKASDDVERAGGACATAFVWRASYYDMILLAVQCEHGGPAALEIGQHVLSLYGEDFAEYIQEMNHA